MAYPRWTWLACTEPGPHRQRVRPHRPTSVAVQAADLCTCAFGMTHATITYRCNIQASTYLWPCMIQSKHVRIPEHRYDLSFSQRYIHYFIFLMLSSLLHWSLVSQTFPGCSVEFDFCRWRCFLSSMVTTLALVYYCKWSWCMTCITTREM